MDEREDNGFRRPTGREWTDGYQRYVADWERDPIPGVHNTVEIGSDGLPTGVELSLFRFDGHHWCGGQAASAVSYSAGLR